MKIPPFQRFNQSEVVCNLSTALVHEFLQRFENELKARQVILPNGHLPDADYLKSAAALLGNQAALPENMAEAILAIEEMAAPEQNQRREAAFWESPQELWIDGKSSPENVALHLWLWSPYTRTQAAAPPAASTDALPPGQPSRPAPPVASASVSPSVPPPTRTPPKCLSVVPPPQAVHQSSPATPEPANPKPATTADRCKRRNGKVAQLRKDLRDKVSQMIDDGFTYAEIIEELGPEGAGLNEVNISNWKIDGGHADWLQARARREAIEAREEVTMDLAREHTGITIQQASRQIASTHICELLMDLDHASLSKGIATNPMAFTRLLNALSRLSADELDCARYRAEEADRQARLENDKAAKVPPEDRCITPETLHQIEELLHLR